MRLLLLLAASFAISGLQPALAAPQASPAPAATAASKPAHTPAEPVLIDINSADAAALDTLPGIGDARAKAIIANRPYSDKQQLVDKKVLPASVLADIQNKIALVNINKTPAADMAQILPNVGPVRAQAIVDKRPYSSTQDLVTKGALTQGILSGLKGLITAG